MITLPDLIEPVARTVIAHADELTALDQAIGDGDHGINMQRGGEAVLAKLPELADATWADGLRTAGMTLVMSVGGASGPLYGTFFMQLGKSLADQPLTRDALTAAFGEAVAAVGARGKSAPGQKTMLDVLDPVHRAMVDGIADPAEIRTLADAAAEATIPMQATKGRASFLGERSIGHMDPGARSSALMIDAICQAMEAAS